AGTFYSSLLPTLMVEELAKAIAENNRAKKIFVANIIEEADTRNHTCVDLIKRVTEYVGENAITNVLINESSQHNNEGYIKADTDRLHELSLDLRFKDFEDKTLPGRHKTDELERDVLQISDFAPVALSTGTQSSELPLVSVVMLAWNRKDEVEIGLQELRKCHYPNKEIIVVDNGSNDGTAQLVYDNFPEATVVRSHRNMGMIGYNLGFATARGKYVVMLDDDSHPAPDAIETMVRIWETDKNNEIGIMAFRVINPNIGSLVTHLWEERIVPTEVGRERDITSFPACGAGARRELFDKVGYFDDDFFIYTTEDDLAIRILDNNYRIVYEPRCVSYHRESRKNRSWKRSGRAFRNAAWLNLKHLPLYLLPLMFIRNLFWLFLRSFRNKSFTFFYYAMVGYIEGYLTFWVPLKNRKSVRYKIAVYCLSDTWISRPIFRTIKKIIKDRRYIMDKRGVSP
ncbi:MAG TPA: glycosyltransferase, partial [Pyrinomonadaceae bacterium]|nr:glycosyltransferase [Pyrinomonadaceae bacterium]